MAGNPPYYDNYRWGGPSGIRLPQEVFSVTSTMAQDKETDINIGGVGVTNTINLSLDQTRSSYYTFTNAGTGATTVQWPAVLPGLQFTVFNNSGQSLTAKVAGKTGITILTAKRAILVMDGPSGDIQRVTADT